MKHATHSASNSLPSPPNSTSNSTPSDPHPMAQARLTYALSLMLGSDVEVQLKNGDKIQGNLYTAVNEGIALSNWINLKDGSQTGPPVKKIMKENYVSVKMKMRRRDKMVKPHFQSYQNAQDLQPGKSFQTDTQITKRRHNGSGRVLQKWNSDSKNPQGNMTLSQDAKRHQNRGQPWDQFQANASKFGIIAEFDESQYTTQPVSMSDLTPSQIARAARAERAIVKGGNRDREIVNRDKIPASKTETESKKSPWDDIEMSNVEVEGEDDEEAMFGAVLGTGRYKVQEESSIQPLSPVQIQPLTPTPPMYKSEYQKTREMIVSGKGKALMQTHKEIEALSLEIARPKQNQELVKKFMAFKKMKTEVDISDDDVRKEMNAELRSFSSKLDTTLKTLSKVLSKQRQSESDAPLTPTLISRLNPSANTFQPSIRSSSFSYDERVEEFVPIARASTSMFGNHIELPLPVIKQSIEEIEETEVNYCEDLIDIYFTGWNELYT